MQPPIESCTAESFPVGAFLRHKGEWKFINTIVDAGRDFYFYGPHRTFIYKCGPKQRVLFRRSLRIDNQ